jgi:hypothetical protein
VAGGIVLQAITFALSHGYQGWRFILLIAVLGAMLGVLAHALRDGVTGIVASRLLR